MEEDQFNEKNQLPEGELDIPLHAGVWCYNELVGADTSVIIEPITRTVTHIVVMEYKKPTITHLVPAKRIIEGASDLIRLNCTLEELESMPVFSEIMTFTPGANRGGFHQTLAYSMPDLPSTMVGHERIPPGELSLRRGTSVYARDGKVGTIEEFLVDPQTSKVQNLVVRESHLSHQSKEVCIHISQVERIEKDKIHLRVDKKTIDCMPPVELRKALPEED